jgi:hypothetical protein
MDQGSAGDCGLFRLLMFERVSEISGVPATHTVPTLFPDQLLPGCELIPGYSVPAGYLLPFTVTRDQHPVKTTQGAWCDTG